MRQSSLAISFIFHVVCCVLLWMCAGSMENALEMRSFSSTVPIEVTVVSDVSQSPISRPRSDQDGSNETKSYHKESAINKRTRTVTSKKNSSPQKKRAPPRKKTAASKKRMDPVGDLIERVFSQEKNDTRKKRHLKNLESKKGGDAETPITDPDSESDYGAPEVGPLSIGVLDRVQKILEKEWVVPFTLQGGVLRVIMALHMNRNGTIRRASVLDQQSTVSHPSYTAARQSALKAIAPFYRKPLPLPLSHYSQWKEFEFSFVRDVSDS